MVTGTGSECRALLLSLMLTCLLLLTFSHLHWLTCLKLLSPAGRFHTPLSQARSLQPGHPSCWWSRWHRAGEPLYLSVVWSPAAVSIGMVYANINKKRKEKAKTFGRASMRSCCSLLPAANSVDLMAYTSLSACALHSTGGLLHSPSSCPLAGTFGMSGLPKRMLRGSLEHRQM